MSESDKYAQELDLVIKKACNEIIALRHKLDSLSAELEGVKNQQKSEKDNLISAKSIDSHLESLVEAAHGLSFGSDWNNGNQAISCRYRHKLLVAIADLMGEKASPQALTALEAERKRISHK